MYDTPWLFTNFRSLQIMLVGVTTTGLETNTCLQQQHLLDHYHMILIVTLLLSHLSLMHQR